VNRQHVITAGHCVKNKVMETINVTLGEYHIGEHVISTKYSLLKCIGEHVLPTNYSLLKCIGEHVLPTN
jgi:hypothetical protein